MILLHTTSDYVKYIYTCRICPATDVQVGRLLQSTLLYKVLLCNNVLLGMDCVYNSMVPLLSSRSYL